MSEYPKDETEKKLEAGESVLFVVVVVVVENVPWL